MKLFPTQEVGSLSKAPFLKKITRERIEETRRWGELLGVEGLDELLNLLRDPDKAYRNMDKLYDYASLFAIRFFEKAGLDVVWDGEQRRIEMYELSLIHI